MSITGVISHKNDSWLVRHQVGTKPFYPHSQELPCAAQPGPTPFTNAVGGHHVNLRNLMPQAKNHWPDMGGQKLEEIEYIKK